MGVCMGVCMGEKGGTRGGDACVDVCVDVWYTDGGQHGVHIMHMGCTFHAYGVHIIQLMYFIINTDVHHHHLCMYHDARVAVHDATCMSCNQ